MWEKGPLEQGPDFWCWFDKTQFLYHCVHAIHAKMFSIQILLHFSQIVPRTCTLVLFIEPAVKYSCEINYEEELFVNSFRFEGSLVAFGSSLICTASNVNFFQLVLEKDI